MFKYIGTFRDEFINIDYDLCIINSLEFKNIIEKEYNLNPLKLALFNRDSHIIDLVHTLEKYGDLEIDKKNGKIIKHIRDEFYISNIKKAEKGEIFDKEDLEVYNVIGYETSSFAVSIKDRNYKEPNNIELIDGFKRIFLTKNVPDRDIFVRVYDYLNSLDWINAMLEFNAYKTLNKEYAAESFITRGFSLGLYKHFNVDISYKGMVPITLMSTYMGNNLYPVLKSNPYFIDDIKLLFSLYKYLKEINQEDDAKYSFDNALILTDSIADVFCRSRENEYSKGKRQKSLEIEDFKVFFDKKENKKHLLKLNKISVSGFKKNHILKNIIPPLIEIFKGKGFEVLNRYDYIDNSKCTITIDESML